ncbi:tyrosine-type recombinase/integrase [Thermaurantiacus sp.]
MPRHLLSAAAVEALATPGRHADGGGLYLHVRTGGSKNWVVRVQKNGRRRDIGLGGYPKLRLADARKRAAEVLRQIELGLDPVAERKRAAGMPSFRQAAAARHRELEKGFRNAKHRAQWLSSLEAHVCPVLGDMGIDAIGAAHVRDALLPIWLEKPETARRVLQRIGDVLAWGVAQGYRDAMPLLTAKALRLPKQSRAVAHHAAMPFAEVPAFIALLREREGVSRVALEFAILTAARSGEVRGATWDEIDLAARLWTVPAERMKAKRAHQVPLSDAALDCLERARPFRRAVTPGEPDLLFPSTFKGGPMSDMALTKLIRDLGLAVTAHGFRSSFRDWTAEATDFPAEVAEMALAHAIASPVEAAYRRGQLLEKRRALMQAWGRFCTSGGGPGDTGHGAMADRHLA